MDIRAVLTELGVPFAEGGQHRHVQRGWYGIDCPQCSPGSGKFKLGIHSGSLAVSCWTCGRQRLGDVLAAASGKPLRDVLRLLPRHGEDYSPTPERPRGHFQPPHGVEPLLPAHKRYLERRGFDPEEIARVWGVGALGPTSNLKWRLYIPVTMNGVQVSWTTRAIGTSHLRYISAPPEAESTPIHNTLYGWDMVRHAVVVTEGPADAWAVGPGAVSTFGVGVTPTQVALLSTIPTRVIAFDNDAAAQKRAREVADSLGVFPGETLIVRLSGKDPAESPPDEIAELRSMIR